MSVPRIFIAGYYEDAQIAFRRVQVRERPQQLRMVLCQEPQHVRGHLLRRRDRVMILRGANPEVIYELNVLEIRRDMALAGLKTYHLELGRLHFWQYRQRRRIQARIDKMEQELG